MNTNTDIIAMLAHMDSKLRPRECVCNCPQGEQGPIGPKGDTGPQGPKGDTGPKGDCTCKCYIYLGQWDGNNNYPLKFNNCIVYVSLGEKMYENLINNNLNHNPKTNPTKWTLIFG